jgi:DNA primase
VAVQPDGLDPCDLRIKHGDAAVRDLVAGRDPLFAFAIRSAIARFDMNTNEGKLSALDAAAPIVASIKDRALRQMYAVDLDRWLGFMNERFVVERVAEIAARPVAIAPAARTAQPAEPVSPYAKLEAEALKLAVQRPALLGPEFDALPPDTFTAPHLAELFQLVVEAGGTATAGGGGRAWVERLLTAASDELRPLITRFAVEELRVISEERYGTQVLVRIQEIAVGRTLDRLKARMQRINPVEEQQEYNRMFGELAALEQQRRVLRERAAGA